MNRPRLSYPPENRVLSRRDFDALYQKGTKSRFNSYILFYLPSDKPRLGISIPKRLGNAVFRNKQKRLLRETFRKVKHEFQTPLDLLFIMVHDPANLENQTRELNRIFTWLSSLKNTSVKS